MKEKLPKIAATLKYGRSHGAVVKTCCWIANVCGLICVLCTIPACIDEGWGTAVWVLAFGGGGIGIGIGCTAWHYRVVKKLRLWLRDAESRRAYVRTCDVQYSREIGAVKVCVEFSYDKKKIRKYSKYDVVYGKYGGAEIDILYSPKYDEVLIPKEQKNIKYRPW